MLSSCLGRSLFYHQLVWSSKHILYMYSKAIVNFRVSWSCYRIYDNIRNVGSAFLCVWQCIYHVYSIHRSCFCCTINNLYKIHTYLLNKTNGWSQWDKRKKCGMRIEVNKTINTRFLETENMCNNIYFAYETILLVWFHGHEYRKLRCSTHLHGRSVPSTVCCGWIPLNSRVWILWK